MADWIDEEMPVKSRPLEDFAQRLRVQFVEPLPANRLRLDEARIKQDAQVL